MISVIIFLIAIIFLSIYREKIKYKDHITVGVIITSLIVILLSWIQDLHKQQDCVSSYNEHRKNGFYGNGCFDIMHLMHILLWMFIGILSPDHYILIIILSTLWEIFEHYAFKYLGVCTDGYCGRVEDVFLNLLGYTFGSVIANI